MQITSIKDNNLECCKRRRLTNFGSNLTPDNGKERVRYKHIEQACDEVLITNSVMKAHDKINNSGKMRLYKALPGITTGIVAAGITLTQPGKLSNKIAHGLGFLALAEGTKIASDMLHKKYPEDSETSNFLASFGTVCASVLAGGALLKGMGKIKALDGLKNFAQKETSKLAQEINSTKLAEFSDKHIQPILTKFPKASVASLLGLTAVTACAGDALGKSLMKDMKKDFSNQVNSNFIRAKEVQKKAQEHFDSVEGREV
ncbi:hypothetical protein IJ670_01615 [bacterium]|nr:hypothetical protein [bacterium]